MKKKSKPKIRDPYHQHSLTKIAPIFKHRNDKRKKDKEQKELEERINEHN